MKNTQKKKIARSYQLLTKDCHRETALSARSTLHTRFPTLLRHNVTMTSMAAVTRRHFPDSTFVQQMVTSRYFLFLRIFHLPFSFNSRSFYLGWSLNAQQGLKWRFPRYPRPYWQKRSVSTKQQDNGKQKLTLNALYKVNILWSKNVLPETRCISLQCLIHHCDCFQKRWTFEK